MPVTVCEINIVVIIFPIFCPTVIRRVYVNAINLFRVEVFKKLQRMEIVSFDQRMPQATAGRIGYAVHRDKGRKNRLAKLRHGNERVNRTLAFVVKYLNSEISDVTIEAAIVNRVKQLYDSVGTKIEKGAFREALGDIFECIRFGNTYYDIKKPWKTRVDNISGCKKTIAVCAYLIANIANLLHPFLPFSSRKISNWLGTTPQWKEQEISVYKISSDISILFSKIE